MTETLQEKLIWIKDEADDGWSANPLRGHYRRNGAPAIRRKITDESPIGDLHISDGLNHSTGLLALVERATNAGETPPPTALLDNRKRKSQHLWTERARREVLVAAAHRENVVEWAHSHVRSEYQELADIRDDTSLALAMRVSAGEKALEIVQNYETRLKAKMAEYDSTALPEDLPTLKEVYIERIEAEAMRRIKFLKGATSQQGIDIPSTCDDMAHAVRRVSQECHAGVTAVGEAGKRDVAAEKYATAITSIAAVWPANTPTIEVNEIRRSPEGHRLVATATQPDGVTGTVTIRTMDEDQDFGRALTRPNAQSVRLELSLPGGESYPFRVGFLARNMCGPAVLYYDVADPDSD